MLVNQPTVQRNTLLKYKIKEDILYYLKIKERNLLEIDKKEQNNNTKSETKFKTIFTKV